jgi:hypothetical protein
LVGVSFGLRPLFTPHGTGAAFPCPRADQSRSNYANPPSTVSISRPCAVVVSAHVSPSDRNPALSVMGGNGVQQARNALIVSLS